MEPQDVAALGSVLGGTIEPDGSLGQASPGWPRAGSRGRRRPGGLVRRARAAGRRAADHRGHAGGAIPRADRGGSGRRRGRRSCRSRTCGRRGCRRAAGRAATAPRTIEGGWRMTTRATADILHPGDGRPSSVARAGGRDHGDGAPADVASPGEPLRDAPAASRPARLLRVGPGPAGRGDGPAGCGADRRRPAGHPRDGDRRGRPGEPRDLDRLRALLRCPQAPRRLAADARPAAGREDRDDRRGRGRPGDPPRRTGRRPLRVGARARLEPARPSSRPSSSARPRSARWASSSPAPCAPRRRWP